MDVGIKRQEGHMTLFILMKMELELNLKLKRLLSSS